MVSILFWNINNRSLENSLAKLSKEHQPDIIVLAESKLHPSKILTRINELVYPES